MILSDTSVWVDHLRQGEPELLALLDGEQVLAHPFVVGELALGGLKPGSSAIRLLDRLERAIVAKPEEVNDVIERHHLVGAGIGYVDACLVTSALLSGCLIWTKDGKLASVARRMGLDGAPPGEGT